MDWYPLRVSLARRFKLGQDSIDLVHLIVSELDHLAVLLDPRDSGRPRDGDDGRHPRSARETAHPVDGELRGRASLLGGELLDLADELDVDLEGVRLEPRVPAQHRVFRDIVQRLDLAREQAASEGRVCD